MNAGIGDRSVPAAATAASTSPARKVAVTLPEELFDIIEQLCDIERRSRFDVFQDALRHCFGESVSVLIEEERRLVEEALSLTGVVHVREQLTPFGTFHVLERFDLTWTTDDGFAGTARQVLTATDRNPGTFDDFVTHLTLHFIGRDGSSRVAQTRELVVLNLRHGEAIVETERFDERCSGRR